MNRPPERLQYATPPPGGRRPAWVKWVIIGAVVFAVALVASFLIPSRVTVTVGSGPGGGGSGPTPVTTTAPAEE
jgi:hypothetical protein